jgi:hypothetical protein
VDPGGHLPELDRAALEPPVRRALGSATATVASWRAAPLGGGIGAALGGGLLHRLAGTAREGGAERPWSLVLKFLRPPPAAATRTVANRPDPGHQFCWKREALLYGSGLLEGLPAGFAAPRCYGVEERADGIRLWLEDIAEPGGARWSLARYGEAARHLGRFNGASLVGRPLPEAPWLCRDAVRWRAEFAAPFWDALDAHRADPRVRRGWPGEATDRAPGVDRAGPLPRRARPPAAGPLPRRRGPPQPARPRRRRRHDRDGGDRLGAGRPARRGH